MPKKVIEKALPVRQIVLVASVLLQIAAALIVTIFPAVNTLLWVPALVIGAVLAVAFIGVRQHKIGRYIWRGVGAALALVVVGALGVFLYAFFLQGAFAEAALDWLQVTAVYAYTVVLCTLTAPLTAALYRHRWDMWVLRILTALNLILALYIHIFDYYYIGTVVHTAGTEWLQYVLMALAAVSAVVPWLLQTEEKAAQQA